MPIRFDIAVLMLCFRAARAARKCSFFLGQPNFAEFVPNVNHSALAEYGSRTILVYVPNTFFSLGYLLLWDLKPSGTN